MKQQRKWVDGWRSNAHQHGWLAIGLHWSSAILIITLLILGLWMIKLSYYSQWYYTAPALHASLGMLFTAVLILRCSWRLTNAQPIITGTGFERRAAGISHWLIYWILFAICISGYLIVTAAGSGISVFGLIELPAAPLQFDNQADIAGWWHRCLSYLLIAMVAMHIAAALKRQLINGDGTLSRMLGRVSNPGNTF